MTGSAEMPRPAWKCGQWPMRILQCCAAPASTQSICISGTSPPSTIYTEKATSGVQEISGFAYPNPALSSAKQWEALDEFTAMAEKHDLWVIPHFVHTPFNEDLDSLSRTDVQQRAETIAGWAGWFISSLSKRHKNILAWGALYALEPAQDDQPENPNNYSLLWRKLYVALKRKIEAESVGAPPPLFTFLFLPSKGKNISTPDAPVPRGALEGYEMDARIAKRRWVSMKRHLSYELGRAAEPDLVYTYLFGPDTAALERSIRELTTGKDVLAADRLSLPGGRCCESRRDGTGSAVEFERGA